MHGVGGSDDTEYNFTKKSCDVMMADPHSPPYYSAPRDGDIQTHHQSPPFGARRAQPASHDELHEKPYRNWEFGSMYNDDVKIGKRLQDRQNRCCFLQIKRAFFSDARASCIKGRGIWRTRWLRICASWCVQRPQREAHVQRPDDARGKHLLRASLPLSGVSGSTTVGEKELWW